MTLLPADQKYSLCPGGLNFPGPERPQFADFPNGLVVGPEEVAGECHGVRTRARQLGQGLAPNPFRPSMTTIAPVILRAPGS
jgi:hypothetical protein